MRIRELSTLHSSIDLSGTHNPNCNVEAWAPWSSGLMSGIKARFEDLPTPDFRKKQANGEVIITPMSSRVENRTVVPGSFTRIAAAYLDCQAPLGIPETDYVQNISGPIGPLYAREHLEPEGLFSSDEISELTNVVATACYANSAEHEAGILEDLAQYKATVDMIRDPLLRAHQWVDRYSDRINNAKVKALVKVGGRLPNYWLQYRYGISPLIGTMDAILKEAQKQHGARRTTSRAKSSMATSRSSQFTVSDSAGSYTFIAQDTDELTVRSGIIRQQDLSMANVLGVDAAGSAALPWQLMPWSFVADWFANVESYLQAVPAYLKNDSLGGWMSSERVNSRFVECVAYVPAPPYTSTSVPGGSSLVSVTTKDRSVGLPAPSIGVRPRVLQKILVEPDLRVVDSFALLYGKLDSLFGDAIRTRSRKTSFAKGIV